MSESKNENENGMENNKKELEKKLLLIIGSSSSIAILTSLIVYFFPYTYLIGYYSYFSLPSMFRIFDLKANLDVSLYIIGAFFTFLFMIGIFILLYYFLDKFVDKISKGIADVKVIAKSIVVRGIFYCISCIIIILLLIFGVVEYNLIGVIIFLLLLFLVVLGCTILYIFLDKRGKLYSYILSGIFSFMFITGIVTLLGFSFAANKSTFYLINKYEGDSLIILNNIQDFYVVATFDKDNNVMIKEFKLINNTEDITITFVELEDPPDILSSVNYNEIYLTNK